jgi:hypothetical protein
MLRSEVIDELVAAGTLQPWKAPGVLEARRGFYATPRVIQALERDWPVDSGKSEADMAALKQDMLDVISLWQSGASMLAPKQLKPMRPPPACEGVWELRSTESPPGARTFGLLPARNIFVATGVALRNRLGPRGSQGWVTMIGVALVASRAWFPDPQPISWPTQKRFDQVGIKVVCDDFG